MTEVAGELVDVQFKENIVLLEFITVNDETMGVTVQIQVKCLLIHLDLSMGMNGSYLLGEPLRYIPIRRYSFSSFSFGIRQVYTPS